jgi:hypothetical protein
MILRALFFLFTILQLLIYSGKTAMMNLAIQPTQGAPYMANTVIPYVCLGLAVVQQAAVDFSERGDMDAGRWLLQEGFQWTEMAANQAFSESAWRRWIAEGCPRLNLKRNRGGDHE